MERVDVSACADTGSAEHMSEGCERVKEFLKQAFR